MKTHSGEKPHACDHPGCDKAFLRKGGLNNHLKVHSKKDYTCETCGKAFAVKSTLLSHQRIHTG